MRSLCPAVILFALCVACAAPADPANTAPVEPQPVEPAGLPDAEESILARLEAEAGALRELVDSKLAESFLDATAELPDGRAQTLYRLADGGGWLHADQLIDLAPHARDELEASEWSAARFYITKYGSPLAYTRAVEILGDAGVESFEGQRVLDYGYGTIGHLRLMAQNGARVVGVDPDPLLRALYSGPDDTGFVPRDDASAGRIDLLEGRWPSTAAMRDGVGTGYDLVISKNTLKRGYVHPEREADPRHLLHMGVDDEQFVQHLKRIVKPGGHVLIYNLTPPQAADDEPYIPWADGRCPFDKQLWIDNDFQIVAFDVDDSEAAREMGRALGWENEERSLDTTLFGTYSLFKRF
ncbi:MAG: hypothetical protein DHS20C15_33790 [Planctomycetota bacterium]|nr:MAG: hypothetical protein DHS20C15_33790 [Planctomycetota bacterium]